MRITQSASLQRFLARRASQAAHVIANVPASRETAAATPIRVYVVTRDGDEIVTHARDTRGETVLELRTRYGARAITLAATLPSGESARLRIDRTGHLVEDTLASLPPRGREALGALHHDFAREEAPDAADLSYSWALALARDDA
jgi:hypothetical protein